MSLTINIYYTGENVKKSTEKSGIPRTSSLGGK